MQKQAYRLRIFVLNELNMILFSEAEKKLLINWYDCGIARLALESKIKTID